MIKTISLEKLLQLENPILIDLRAPSEYAEGHLPGAINVPLLDDEERVLVGTTYRQTGPEKAKEEGLSIVSGKLPQLVKTIREHAGSERQLVIYCWRGGMRSRSVVSVLELMGVKAYQLIGGFKAYRQHLLATLAEYPLKPEIVVLCGSTGVGKTAILQLLAEKGIPVIDLEMLANHRGSAFGQVGLGKPQTAQIFDSLLLTELNRFNDKPYIVVECESKRIGNVYLPDPLYQAMARGKKILAHASVKTRVCRLIAEYNATCPDCLTELSGSLASLQKKLGVVRTRQLQELLTQGRMEEVVEVLLADYYDPLYGYENDDPGNYAFVTDAEDLGAAADQIIDYLKTVRG